MNVLIFAYACDPNRGSELGLGWNISSEIAKRHKVTLVTREKNREIYEKYLAEHPDAPHAKTRFIFYDTNGFWRKFKDKLPFGTQVYFSNWLKTAVKRFRKEVASADVVHQLTFCPFFVRPWGAAYTQRYIWGPIGGGGGPDARMGKDFLENESLAAAFTEWMYRMISWYVNKSVFGIPFRKIRTRARAVLFKAKAFGADYVAPENQIVKVTKETGYSGEFKRHEYVTAKHPLRVMMVGRMIPFKAFGYGIKAFAKFIDQGGEGELHLFGDGPLRQNLERLVLSLKKTTRAENLQEKIIFHGNVSNAEVHAALDSSDIFFHPSFIEAGAWSIMEAMIHGVPVLCQNRSGMADMVTAECGTLVSATTPDALVECFSSALMNYYGNPNLISRQGRFAQMRVKDEYSWQHIGEAFEEVYHAI